LIVQQPDRVLLGALFGSLSLAAMTAPPYLLSRAVDDGLVPGDMSVLLLWAGVLLAAGITEAWLGIMRHRTMTRVRIDANLRTVRVVVRHATRVGAALGGRVTAGEVAAIGFGDVTAISRTLTVAGPGVGAVLGYAVIAVLLFSVSALLAVVVLVGVPVLVLVVGPLLGRMQGTASTYRAHQGALTARFVDMATGLRVLGGLGGKDIYARRYRDASTTLRDEGYRLGTVTSWIQALGVGMPALFLAVVTWLAARMVAQGTISAGELVAVYGYAAVLVVPVAIFIESGMDIGRGLVAARQVVRFLNVAPDGRANGVDAPPAPATLHDPASGVEIRPGRLTALVSERAADAAGVVDRLGGFTASDATWGGVRLDAIATHRIRERIVVADNDAYLFAGPFREVVGPRPDHDEAELARAVHVAMARDVVDALPDGLDSTVRAQGLNLSGGQRQRVRLVRALLAEPEVLMAVDPASALDTHTEAAVAARLREERRDRTTVVTGTSPLLLAQADVVHHLVGGRVVASGSHHHLLAEDPGYRRLVARAEGEDEL
jgi:ABC-type multidrug transport system fused ATPase/permease subunit